VNPYRRYTHHTSPAAEADIDCLVGFYQKLELHTIKRRLFSPDDIRDFVSAGACALNDKWISDWNDRRDSDDCECNNEWGDYMDNEPMNPSD
jgi:hypothetical protein